jgi:hypothetical protein
MSESDIISGIKQLNYSANDWFYMNNNKCGDIDCSSAANANNECCKNKAAVQTLKSTTNSLGATVTQYNDAKMLYNRELLFTVNILAGLAMLCYYIYLNQDVFPTPSDIMQKVGNVGKSIADSAKSQISTVGSSIAK